jgi:hypothetical protein
MVESGPEPSQLRWTLRDSIGAVALFAVTAGVILWQDAHVAVLWDISYILNVATRIAGGQIPYRDFPLAHAPLTFLLQAAIVRLTGRVFFHHVLYVAVVGALSTVLTWRIALSTLRGRIAAAWPVSLLLASPLIFLSVYSIMPNPEYDSDCAFSILVAVWALQRVELALRGLEVAPVSGPYLSTSHQQITCHPERSLARNKGQTQSKDLRLSFAPMLRAFLAGIALVIPLFFKQNMGLPFLVASVFGVLLVLIATRFNRKSSPKSEPRLALSLLAGVCAALLAGALALESTPGLANYLHWTIAYAGQRRLPGFDLMLGVYWYPALAWMLPCAVAGLLVLSSKIGKKFWAEIAAFLLLAAPFLSALLTLVLDYDDADSRGDSFLMIWPVMLVLATAMALASLLRCWRRPSLRALLPLILLAAINGTMMSQQLWGSTYGIWPLLILLLAEMLAVLHEIATRSGASRQFAPAFAVFVSAALLICGARYTFSEERLSYAKLPDGPVMHSTFAALAGMSTPGPYLPELDEMLRYVNANIPDDDSIMEMPGEDPLFFATGRAQPFPTTIWDHTCLPWSPAQIADLARSLHIRWLIVKTDLQLTEDSTPDRPETMRLLMQEFTLAAHLRGYDVYRARTAE